MKRKSLKRMLNISVFSALIAVSAMISIPLAVPVTLQLFAVFLAFMTIGGRDSLIAILIYTALGAFGLPVFAGFGAGIGYIMGASGGFIIAFPLAALLYMMLERIFGKKRKRRKLFYSFASLALIYALGCSWFALVYSGGAGFGAAFAATVLPFMGIDVIKIFLAYTLSARLKAIINI